MTRVKGITDVQLERLRDGGWTDREDNHRRPSWIRWVGDAKVGDVLAAQEIWLVVRRIWLAGAGPESPDSVVFEADALDAALDQCDEWKGTLPVASAPGNLTKQSEKF